ncbi:hypothetical protein BCV71DRAFT_232458 [Rhizopus microsporus]|uniref:Uncharacterized protein n=1 Tax=Rhizopus microsporus TaxID=58291 RepID=A0A1X0SAK3_RHIZD|nr:hypothetical protein BCV71DRAFT_232458 [Rhizopus microsporus]
MSTLNEDGQPMPKRVTRRSIIWKIKYICHRAGAYKSRAGVQTEDESSKSRPIQKPSKKINCKCYVTVTCYFLHIGHDHLIGSLGDISFLPLLDNTKEAILQKLREDCGLFYFWIKILPNFCLSVSCVVPGINYIVMGLDEVIDIMVCKLKNIYS